jgi:hypothetical protein
MEAPMAKRSTCALAACAAFAALFVPLRAFAADWLPLSVGNRWEYRGVGGAHQAETITGQTTVRSRVVSVKYYAEGVDAGLENYWYLDPDGSVRLAGFKSPGAGLAYAYEPPVRILHAPPVVGIIDLPGPVDVYDLLTGVFQFTTYLSYDVGEHVTLTLPAGTFDAWGVGQVIMLPGPSLKSGSRLGIDGRTLASSGAPIYSLTVTDWYSEGTGDVQYQSSDLYQLVGFGRPTPVLASSWGNLKRLYR